MEEQLCQHHWLMECLEGLEGLGTLKPGVQTHLQQHTLAMTKSRGGLPIDTSCAALLNACVTDFRKRVLHHAVRWHH